jgi:integrase
VCSNGAWSAKTKSIYITAAQRLFGFYEARNDGVPRISTKGLKPKRTQPAGHDRQGFTLLECQVLFQNAATYREKAPHKWWITVACAFLGCRIEELAQAHLGRDIARDETTGFWFLRIDELAADNAATNGNLQKSVKTFSAWRMVPIHPVLVDAGFIDYLNSEADAGAKTPFERHWKPFRDKKTRGVKYSHSAVKWGMNELNKLRREKLITRGGLTYFHSMRHTFTTLLAGADIGEEWRAALAGHSYGGMNAQVYNKAKHDLAKTSPIVVRGLEGLAAVLRQLVSDTSAHRL